MDVKNVLRKLIGKQSKYAPDASETNQLDAAEAESQTELTDKDLEQVQGGLSLQANLQYKISPEIKLSPTFNTNNTTSGF